MWRLLATLCLLVHTVVRTSALPENEASHEYSYEYYEDEDHGEVNVSEHIKDYLTNMLHMKSKTTATPVITPDIKDKTNQNTQPERFIHFLGDNLRRKHAYNHIHGSKNGKVASDLSHQTSKYINHRLNALETTSAKNQFMKNAMRKGPIGLVSINDNLKGVRFNALSNPDMIGNAERESFKDVNSSKTKLNVLAKNTEVNTHPSHLFETPKTISDGLNLSKTKSINHRLIGDLFSSGSKSAGAMRNNSESINNYFSAPVKLDKPVGKLYRVDSSKNARNVMIKNIDRSRVEDIKNKVKDMRTAINPIKNTIGYPSKIFKTLKHAPEYHNKIKQKNTAAYSTHIIHPFRSRKTFKDISSNILSTKNKPLSFQITNNLPQGLDMKELKPDAGFAESGPLKYQGQLNDISNFKQIYEGVAEENVLKGNSYKSSYIIKGNILNSGKETNLKKLFLNSRTEYPRNSSNSLPNLNSYLSHSPDKIPLGDTTNYSMFSFIPKPLIDNYRENLKGILKSIQPYSNTIKHNITYRQKSHNKINSILKTDKYLNKTQNDVKSKEKVDIPVNISSDHHLKSVNISTTQDKYFQNKSDNIKPPLTLVQNSHKNLSNNIVHVNLTGLISFIMKDIKSVADEKYVYAPSNLTVLRHMTEFDYSAPQELEILINHLTKVMVKNIYGKSIKRKKVRKVKRKGSEMNEEYSSTNKLDDAKIKNKQNKYESDVNKKGLVEDETQNNGDNSTLLIVDDIKPLGDGNYILIQSTSAKLNDTTNFSYSSPHPLEELIDHLAHVLSRNIKKRKVKKIMVNSLKKNKYIVSNTTEPKLNENKKLNKAKIGKFENNTNEKKIFKETDRPYLQLKENKGKYNNGKRVDSLPQEKFKIIYDKPDKVENKSAERIEISGKISNSSTEYTKENENLSSNNTQHSIQNSQDKLNKSQIINTLTDTDLNILKPNTVNGSLKTNRKSEINVNYYHTTPRPTDLALKSSLANLENKTNLIEPSITCQNLSFTNDSYLTIQHENKVDCNIESKETNNLGIIDNKDSKIINNTYNISKEHKDEMQHDKTNAVRLTINNNITRDLPIYITWNNTSVIINILRTPDIVNNNNTITQYERNRTGRHEVESRNSKPTKNGVLQEIGNGLTKQISNQNYSHDNYLNKVIDNSSLISDSLSKIKRDETILNSKSTQPGTKKKITKVTKKTLTVESNIIETISENKK